MWKWKRSDNGTATDGVAIEPARSGPVQLEQMDAAFDTLASVLRAYGQHPLDLESVEIPNFQQLCEAWALHVLVSSPRPDQPTQRSIEQGGRREWAAVRQFFLDSRRHEQQQVARSLGDFREVTWAFIQSLNSTFAQDETADERVMGHLEKLRTVVVARSTEEIKREVVSTVNALATLVEERKQRQQAAMEELGNKVARLADQLQEAIQENETDGLTRIFNRPAFDLHVQKVANLRNVFNQPACMLMFDVDHFKWINDTHGHPTGDAVLKELADCLAGYFPRKTDFVGRYGGDEFVVILTDTRLADGMRLAERVLNAIRALDIPVTGDPFRLSVSIGITEVQRSETAQQWLERTDQALYQAKQAGRDRLAAA